MFLRLYPRKPPYIHVGIMKIKNKIKVSINGELFLIWINIIHIMISEKSSCRRVCGCMKQFKIRLNRPLYPQVLHPQVQATVNRKYSEKKFQKVPKSKTSICPLSGNYLHSIYFLFTTMYIVFTTIYIAFTLY